MKISFYPVLAMVKMMENTYLPGLIVALLDTFYLALLAEHAIKAFKGLETKLRYSQKNIVLCKKFQHLDTSSPPPRATSPELLSVNRS